MKERLELIPTGLQLPDFIAFDIIKNGKKIGETHSTLSKEESQEVQIILKQAVARKEKSIN